MKFIRLYLVQLQLFLVLLLLIVSVGCGQKLFNVSGTITLSDGTPLPTGKVFFISGITQAEGTLDQSGSYSLSLQKGKRGIPAGSYQVLVTGVFFTPQNVVINDEMDTGTRPMIDLIYAETETTPLHCTVPNENGYDFVVNPSTFYNAEK
jgi:hypothetical protein